MAWVCAPSCEALVTDDLAVWIWFVSDPRLSKSHNRIDASAPPDTMLSGLAKALQEVMRTSRLPSSLELVNRQHIHTRLVR